MVQAKKLSLTELKEKAMSSNVIANMNSIQGGAAEEYCHNGRGKELQDAFKGLKDFGESLQKAFGKY